MSRLRILREARGLRREDIASRALISYEYARKLEGKQPPIPTLSVARRIADVLGVHVDEVFPPSKAPEPQEVAS